MLLIIIAYVFRINLTRKCLTTPFNTTDIIIDTLKNETSDQLSKVLATLHRNDINKLSPHGMGPIHHACLEGELEIVECLTTQRRPFSPRH